MRGLNLLISPLAALAALEGINQPRWGGRATAARPAKKRNPNAAKQAAAKRARKATRRNGR